MWREPSLHGWGAEVTLVNIMVCIISFKLTIVIYYLREIANR